MEIEHLHRLIDEKKWTLILHELDHVISKKDSSDDDLILSTFEKIDRKYREQNAQRYYFDLWKIAYRNGKIKLAKAYAEFILDYLIEYKRVPAIKVLINEFQEYGLFKPNKKFKISEVILGRATLVDTDEYEIYEYHPELWKNQKAFLKNYLTTKENWELEDWKLAYEYILKFYYEKDLFIQLTQKANSMKKHESHIKFEKFISEKGVKLEAPAAVKSTKVKEKDIVLSTDYDQLAMDVMSGVLEPSITEQKRILVSIQDLTNEEIQQKGKDMIIAFGLLGMDQVVVSLCERAIPLISDVKERASLIFMQAQSLFNKGDFYKVIDLVNDTFSREALVPEEAIAFDYIQAESFLRLKKINQAKEIYIRIKKQNPNYRLVGERLRSFDEIK